MVRIMKRTARQAKAITLVHDDPPIVSRMFTFSLPEDFGYDHEDVDDITNAFFAMTPKPEEVQEPVPSGLGDLVFDAFVVTFTDDNRSDEVIKAALLAAVRSALRPRRWEFQDD